MNGVFNNEIFNNSIFNVGEVGVVGFGPGIGLAPEEPHKPVDFVIATGWAVPIPNFRPMARRVQKPQEHSELREMMEMYSQWRVAA